MTDNREFDWTEILPEPERTKVRNERRGTLEEFLDRFPTKEEIEQAGREGREAFFEARAQVDKARIAGLTAELRKLQDIIGTQADRILDLQTALEASQELLVTSLHYEDNEYLEDTNDRCAANRKLLGPIAS